MIWRGQEIFIKPPHCCFNCDEFMSGLSKKNYDEPHTISASSGGSFCVSDSIGVFDIRQVDNNRKLQTKTIFHSFMYSNKGGSWHIENIEER